MTTPGSTSSTDASPASGTATPWYRDRQRLSIAGGIGLVAIAAVVYFVRESIERKEQFATRSLNEAQAAMDQGNLPAASSGFQQVVTAYHGTDAAAEAVLGLNQIRLQNGQAELAVASLREFLTSSPEARYAVSASSLLGAALESGQHWEEAGDAYVQAADLASQEYLKATYLIDAGRAYRMGGLTDKAIDVYQTVIGQHAEAPGVVEAQIRLAELTQGRLGALPDSGSAAS